VNRKELALAAVFAALYAALGYVFAPIGFLAIQVRIACALVPLIALFKWPALLGITLGQFLTNIISPLGFLDLLSPLVALPSRYLLIRFGLKALPATILTIGVWVSFMLWSVFSVPIRPTIISVSAGEFMAEAVLGGILYLAIRRRLFK